MSEEKKEIPPRSKVRLSAIDRCRGYSIFYMVLGHSIMYWLLPQEQYIVGFGILGLEIMGANAFILISGMSMSLSYNGYARKIRAVSRDNVQREVWLSRMQIWTRTAWIAGLSFIANIVGTGNFGHSAIWIWLVLQAIWVARSLCYPFLQLPAFSRFLIGIAFFFLADSLRMWSLVNAPLIYQILFFDPTMNPAFPFLGFFFIGSALGSWLDQWTQIKLGGKKSVEVQNFSDSRVQKYFTPRNLAIMGIILVVASISFGWQLEKSDLTPLLVSRINIHPDWSIDSLPAFLVHSNTPWSFFSIGCELIIFAAFLRADIVNINKQAAKIPSNKSENSAITKKTYKNSTKALTLFGQQSLTVYITHFLVLTAFAGQLWFWQWLIVAPTIVAGYHTVIWIWANGKGKGYTLDWLIGYTSDLASKRLIRRYFPVKREQPLEL